MKWFWSKCRRQRREICLLAAGALPEKEHPGSGGMRPSPGAATPELPPHPADSETLAPLNIAATEDGRTPELEHHFANCSACQKYFNEIQTLAAPLAGWEKTFSQIQPTQAMQRRWGGAVQAAATEATVRGTWLNQIWRELIWPCRRVWVGLAALWLALLAVNLQLSDHTIQAADTRSSMAIIQSWEEQTRVLAELTQPAMLHFAPANPALAPASPPRPRSERKQAWQIA